jgi:hypothetical protein
MAAAAGEAAPDLTGISDRLRSGLPAPDREHARDNGEHQRPGRQVEDRNPAATTASPCSEAAPNGWRSAETRDHWASLAEDLAADVRAELGTRAELVIRLWPLDAQE